jgi:hypothetical protein
MVVGRGLMEGNNEEIMGASASTDAPNSSSTSANNSQSTTINSARQKLLNKEAEKRKKRAQQFGKQQSHFMNI